MGLAKDKYGPLWDSGHPNLESVRKYKTHTMFVKAVEKLSLKMNKQRLSSAPSIKDSKKSNTTSS